MSTPEVLYHYTTQESFLKILETKSLLTGNVLLQNDKNEISHGLSIIAKYIRRQRIDEKEKARLLNDLYDEKSYLKYDSIFVFCLSENGDLLSQWRGYTGNKPGYAIGFNKEKLEKLGYEYDFRLCKCLYCADNDRVAFDKIKNNMIIRGEGKSINVHIYNALNKLVEIKDIGFSEENEWRLASSLVSNIHPDIEFMSTQNYIKSYFRIKLKGNGIEDLIDKIVIGPNPDPVLAKYALETYLMNKTSKRIIVENSKIPFRW